jgi:hypothetical protein
METMAPLATEGIRSIPFIEDNPVVGAEVFDLWVAHKRLSGTRDSKLSRVQERRATSIKHMISSL